MEMEKLITGIVLAALSGLTFLAYRHPRAYISVAVPIHGVMFLGWVAGMAWDIGNLHGFHLAESYVDNFQKSHDARMALESTKLLTGPILLCLVGVWTYMTFLFFLPRILGEDSPPNEQSDPKGK